MTEFASAADTDPKALQWMTGFPPAADKAVTYADGSFRSFPQLRWAWSNLRQLMPTVQVWRGNKGPSKLERSDQPLGRVPLTTMDGRAITFEQALLDTMYGDLPCSVVRDAVHIHPTVSELLPTLLGKGKQPKHKFLFWDFGGYGGQQAVRMGDWKAVRHKLADAIELYNLKDDLGEQNNLASKHPEVVKKIEAYLGASRTESAAIDVGGIERSRELESLCVLWVAIGLQRGSWDHAFKVLAR